MKKTKKYLVILVALLFAFTIMPTSVKAASTSKSIGLSSTSAAMAPGKTQTIRLNNTTGTKKVVWKSSDTKVATVKSAGRVTGRLTAKKAGKTIITAKFDGKTYKCTVTVKKPSMEKTAKLTVGQRDALRLNNTTGSRKAVWKSSNTSVVTVKSAGRVTGRMTAKKAGTATITAKFGSKTYKTKVTVRNAKPEKTAYSLKVGQKRGLTLKYVYGSEKVTWKSLNKSVATVKSSSRVRAVVTAKNPGKATIIAKVYGKSRRISITVKSPSLSSTKLSMGADGAKNISLNNTAGTEKAVWKSSNTAVAEVRSTGRTTAKITTKKSGTATITAVFAGKTYKCKVTVAPPELSMDSEKIVVGKDFKLSLRNTVGSEKVTWTSSNTSIASVEGQSRTVGKVTAKKSGKAIITAKWGGKSYKCTVRVLQPEISDKNIRLTPGLSYDIWMDYVLERPDKDPIKGFWVNYTFSEFDLLKTTENVIWKSSNPAVVSVCNKNGDTATLTAKATGTATITATVNGKNYKCKVKVITAYPEPQETYGGKRLTEKENDALQLVSEYGRSETQRGTISNQPFRKAARVGRLVAPTASYRFYKCTIPYFDGLAEEGYFYCNDSSDAGETFTRGYIIR